MRKNTLALSLLLEELTEEIHRQQNAIEAEKALYKQQQKIMSVLSPFSEVIGLNVGGCIYTTTRDTLTKNLPVDGEQHMLCVMINSQFSLSKDKNGNIFIDRSGEHFRYILNYLRCCGDLNVFILPDSTNKDVLRGIAREAHFYGISALSDHIDAMFSSQVAAKPKLQNIEQNVTPSPSSWTGKFVKIITGTYRGCMGTVRSASGSIARIEFLGHSTTKVVEIKHMEQVIVQTKSKIHQSTKPFARRKSFVSY
ncbi:hypothetical protein AKO1_003139 [Acrasis kona]|uniref:Uncharacterized protein n=1 Tax=Acrasis kona TaxID=1008807 RepID=A0AAW2Z6W5_9EUKA